MHFNASNQGEQTVNSPSRVEYQTTPAQYKHWKMEFNGPVATLKADFDENAGLRPGYKLKLNQGEGVLLGRQHLHAGRQQPRLEGELLQVHE